jgi:hypothetical protein
MNQKSAVLSYFAVEAIAVFSGHNLLHPEFHAQAKLTAASVKV